MLFANDRQDRYDRRVMDAELIFQRYQDLQRYVGWTDDDARRVAELLPVVEPNFPQLIDDFYDEIERHPAARKVITGGAAQVDRLKGTLRGWVRQLFSGTYDREYVRRRWQVGLRHVDIGLDQVYTNVALSRMRFGLARLLAADLAANEPERQRAALALNRLLDLDLAIIEDAYQYEYLQRQKRIERLVVIGQMAGGIAHELRNPLNVVRTSAFYLQHAKQPSAEKQAEHLDRIARQVAVADSVITALSDFAKLPLPEFHAVPVKQLLDESLAGVQLPEAIQVGVQCPENVPAVFGDARQLFVVLTNLIRNAVDAMPQGGRLSLTAEPASQHVRIVVADTGAGISPEEVPRIFEPFYSTKVRGIGLGLALTRAIVENHRGEISVTSTLGQGSRFSVLLKIATS